MLLYGMIEAGVLVSDGCMRSGELVLLYDMVYTGVLVSDVRRVSVAIWHGRGWCVGQ